MDKDNVVDLQPLTGILDPLTELLRSDPRQSIGRAVEAEVAIFGYINGVCNPRRKHSTPPRTSAQAFARDGHLAAVFSRVHVRPNNFVNLFQQTSDPGPPSITM